MSDMIEPEIVYEQGWRAREIGFDRTANPHAKMQLAESGLFRFWDTGWMDADREIQMEREHPDCYEDRDD